jgi:hypothetical protein
MEHSYDLDEMYGETYGYRSGLNSAMVTHLHRKVEKICREVPLSSSDLVIDIGSNDSTTLQAYPQDGPTLLGVDPTGNKFQKYYPAHIHLIPDFFSAELLEERFPGRKAKVITSFSMFYDLEAPLAFMSDVYASLDTGGVWVFEQSYMPEMLRTNSYDTVCHEHLEFYALRQIKWMVDRIGFTILDVEFNDVNGGSFSITVGRALDFPGPLPDSIQSILEAEEEAGLDTLVPYKEFSDRVARSKEELVDFISKVRSEGKKIAAIGASTKGNVLLQYCNFCEHDLSFVGEVNVEKFGCFTPGSWIPIVSEEELFEWKPDYLLVLPWHFRSFFSNNKKFDSIKMVYPLPTLEIEFQGRTI